MIWRAVPGCTRYEVSSLGALMSWREPDGRLLESPRGKTTIVDDNGKPVYKSIGSFVAMAFLTPRQPGHLIRYLDGDHLNTAVSNMQWETQSEAGHRKLDHLNKVRPRGPRPKKEKCFRGHPLVEGNIRISGKYGRACIICNKAACKAARLRKKQRAVGEPVTATTEDVLLERGQIEFDVLLGLW